MKIIIQAPDFKARETLMNFVQDNVSKLALLSDRILESRVFLKLDKSDTRENKICEIKLVIPGQDLFASKQSNTFEDALMQTIEAVKPQVERWKDSKRSRESLDSLESEEA